MALNCQQHYLPSIPIYLDFFTLSNVCMHSTLYPQSQTDPYDLYLSISNRFWPVRALPDLLPTGGGLYQLVPARCAGAGPSEVLSEGGRQGAQVPLRNLPVGQIDVARARGVAHGRSCSLSLRTSSSSYRHRPPATVCESLQIQSRLVSTIRRPSYLDEQG